MIVSIEIFCVWETEEMRIWVSYTHIYFVVPKTVLQAREKARFYKKMYLNGSKYRIYLKWGYHMDSFAIYKEWILRYNEM